MAAVFAEALPARATSIRPSSANASGGWEATAVTGFGVRALLARWVEAARTARTQPHRGWLETVDVEEIRIGDHIQETVWSIMQTAEATGRVIQIQQTDQAITLVVALDRRVPRFSGTATQLEVIRRPGEWIRRFRPRSH